ncbi:MAG: hypothetical protein WKF84_09870 [Pyrinomonadaceae bacterium]
MLLALWGLDALRTASIDSLPTTAEINLDAKVLGFTLLISLLTGMLFGLAPTLGASKLDLNNPLKESGRSAIGSASASVCVTCCVVSEIALSLVLLIGAGLLVKSFMRIQQIDPGFNPEKLLTMQIARAAKETKGARWLASSISRQSGSRRCPASQRSPTQTACPFLQAS